MGDTTSLVPGFPIRTSSDPRSVDNSPRHIAASHVLHRPLMPRHPPCALTHLQTQKTKENNSTKQQKNICCFARCSQPLSNTQTPHPTTKRGDNHPTQTGPGVVSGPNSVPAALPPPPPKRSQGNVVAHPVAATTAHDPFTAHTPPTGMFFVVLLRKEVIQPHLPVRLPCYDFVPIADPTFDHSLPKGLGHGLRVLPTFMT